MTSSIFEKANARHYRPGALEASLRDGRSCDAEMARAFETGEAHTRRASHGPAKVLARLSSRFITRGTRQHPTSPDREASRERKRSWAGSGMPRAMWKYYTEGERAALCVVGDQVKRRGYCDLALDRIAAVAGVSRTTVQNALRKARHPELGHVTVEERPRAGRKNLTNIVRIISSAWLGWLKRSIGFKRLNPTIAKESSSSSSAPAEPLHGACERENAGSAGAKGSGGDCGEARLERLKRETMDMERRQRALDSIRGHFSEVELVWDGHDGPGLGGAGGWSPTFGS